MLPEIVTNLNIDTFRRIVALRKLVIIYPSISYRNVFLSYFLQSDQDHLLYYRLPYDGIAIVDWLDNMRRFTPTTDSVLSQPNFKADHAEASGEVLGVILGQYLQSLPHTALIYYWDEIDRTAQDPNFRAFMQALVPLIPPHVQIVVNARKLDYLPWIEFIDRDLCAVLGTNLRKDSLMFTANKDQKPQLEVYAFGKGIALINGTEVTSWDGALPRQMFYYFMDHHLVTRDEIFRVFWPQLPVKEATNVYHVTKRKIGEQITRVVNDGGDYELTQYGAGFYTPNVHIERHYDVAEFETAINAAYMTDDEADQIAHYEKAIHLYQGDFLTSLEMPWVQRRREQLRTKFVDALIGVGRVHKRHDRLTNAISYYIRALRDVPLREDVHRDLMDLYVKLGRRDEAINQYKALSDLLNRSLKVSPSKETKALYDSIVEGEKAY